ncbi:pyruvate kinase [Helicobacter pylori]|uniref:pyruvate kinase n=1 Tax=Helicobacter pylori TaxID=210 RepID=UPI001C57A871|nr:pyruvate kinase [Helicobacter pylori]
MAVDVSSIPFQKFWHMQIHQQHLQVRWDVHDVRQILEEYHFIGLAHWEKGKRQIRDFLEVMRVNDIAAIKHGQQLVALAQVIDGAYNIHKDRALCVSKEEDPLVDWIHYRRPVKILDVDWIHYRRPVKILDWAKEGQTIPQGRGTLNKCVSLETKTSKIIMEWYKKVQEALKAKGERVVLV